MTYRCSVMARQFMPLAACALLGLGGCGDRTATPFGGTIQVDIDPGTEVDRVDSDADIMAVTAAANQGEIVTSQLALTRASDPRVRAYAERMLAEHTAALEQQTALAQRLGVTPTENEASRELAVNAAKGVEAMENETGEEFDREYMDWQADSHEDTLQLLDDELIPRAGNAELRAMLVTMRGAVAAHLEEARAIVDGLDETDNTAAASED